MAVIENATKRQDSDVVIALKAAASRLKKRLAETRSKNVEDQLQAVEDIIKRIQEDGE